jgi:hypothetical protein
MQFPLAYTGFHGSTEQRKREETMQPTDFTPYIVTFADTEVRVEARDCDEAQELAIEKVEGRQGFTTEIVRIVRARIA